MKRYNVVAVLLAGAAAIALLRGAPPAGANVNSIGMELVTLPAGSFEMGQDPAPLPPELIKGANGVTYDRLDDLGDYDEKPAHKVTIAKPFAMSVTEVTVEQYRRFRPDYAGVAYYAPYASGISWDDAVAFTKWLSAKEGKPYRLPTEAEWEYASRAGTRTPFAIPNAWGLKNMHSGVAEWCLDWFGMYPAAPQTDPVGPAAGIAKIVRGGGLDYKASKTDGGKHLPAEMPYYARSSNRASIAPTFSSSTGNIGFRVVQAAMPTTPPLPYDPPLVTVAVKQTAPPDIAHGPDAKQPFYYTRPVFPDLAGRSMPEVGWKLGLKPGLGVAYHNSALQMCPNGDLVAAYYNTPKEEDDPDQTILTMRLRYGAEDWDMPEAWPDFADAADAAPVFWNERGRLWLFFGSPRLLGGYPFQFMSSMDSGATWSPIEFPKLIGPVGPFTPQPINSIVRAKDGTIYMPVDAAGSTSVVFASKDDGKTWRDTGGRTAGRHTTLVLGKDGALIGFGGKNSNIDGFMPKAISHDGGKTWEKSKTPFQPLGSGQRPSLIRLASGRLLFVADLFDKKKLGPTGVGAFVALSDDDGVTWTKRQLPNLDTVGYTTATQTPDGLIHVITSKNKPDYLIDLNEAWVMQGGPQAPAPAAAKDVRAYREQFADGKTKATWSAGVATDGRYVLNGAQVFYYPSGQKQWEATFQNGRRTGTETWFTTRGAKQWERAYAADGTWTWRIFDAAGKVSAESRWQGKKLLDANTEGSLSK